VERLLGKLFNHSFSKFYPWCTRLWYCLILKLQRRFHLDGEDMRDHARSVFEKSAHKLVSQAISNGRIRASNEYLETFEGQQLGSFCDGSDAYLTEEQAAMVKHVGLNFIICLLCFYYF
jgi:hypothetical protein